MVYNEFEKIDKKKIAYVRCNEWSKEIVLFFHGFTGSKNYFPEFDEVNDCIISFDRPGIGESDVLEFYSMEQFIEIVYEILHQHGVSSVKLVGHSAGGYYAQLFCELYPDMVKSLSLVSSMIPLNSTKTKHIMNRQWKFISFLSLKAKAFSRFYFKQMAKSITEYYDKQLVENLKRISNIERTFMENNAGMIRKSVMNAVANDGLGVFYDAFALCQPRKDLKISKDIPVYVWYGTKDHTVPWSFVEYIKSEYSVKQVNVIEGVGHMLYLPYWKSIIKEL